MPTEFAGALAKRVLQPQALLIAHHLMGCRLSDIDHSLARQMGWLDQFGLHEKSPPRLRRRRRRSGAEELAAAPPIDPLDLRSSHSRHSAATVSSRSVAQFSLIRSNHIKFCYRYRD